MELLFVIALSLTKVKKCLTSKIWSYSVYSNHNPELTHYRNYTLVATTLAVIKLILLIHCQHFNIEYCIPEQVS